MDILRQTVLVQYWHTKYKMKHDISYNYSVFRETEYIRKLRKRRKVF